jgi:hypothetical protein
LHVLDDRLAVAQQDPVCPFAELRVIGLVLDPAGERPGHSWVGHENSDADRLGHVAPGANLVQRFLQRAMQRLAREAAEDNRYLWLFEGAFDMRAQTDGSLRARPDEHTAALTGHDEALVTEQP